MALLHARKLVKSYGGRRVVDEVTLAVAAGEIVGLLGRNGAGKTTTFRMVIGMITPEAGGVIFQDTDVTTLPMYRHAQAGMGYLSQEPSVFQRLTVRNNLLAILETQKLSRSARRERADELLTQFGLVHKADEAARTCSGGERRRLEIARALVTRPRLLLLDEPFAAVDPHTVEELQTEVRKLSAEGIAILVTDHNVQQTLRICDRAYIIHEGKNLREGPPKQIINDPLVREAYLASTFRGDEFDEPPEKKDSPRPSAVNLFLLLSAVSTLAGCVERTITITSEPSRALVWLNDREVGRTPLEIEFEFYGTYEVRLEHDGYEPLVTTGVASAPWWETVGIDLVAELIPADLESRVAWHYDLPPVDNDPDRLLERAEALRDRASEPRP